MRTWLRGGRSLVAAVAIAVSVSAHGPAGAESAAGSNNAGHPDRDPAAATQGSIVEKARTTASGWLPSGWLQEAEAWLDRAARVYHTEVAEPLASGGAGPILDRAAAGTSRLIMSWVGMLRYHGSHVAALLGFPVTTAADDAAKAFTEARTRADAEWKVADARTRDAVKAAEDANAASGRADAEKLIADNAAKAKAEIERQRQEHEAHILEGLKKLEEFEAADKARKAEEARRSAEVQKFAEDQRQAYATERAAAEEQRAAAERKAEEERRAAEEQAAAAKRADEEKAAADAKRRAEETERLAEEKRIADETRAAEEKSLAEARIAEDAKRAVEEARAKVAAEADAEVKRRAAETAAKASAAADRALEDRALEEKAAAAAGKRDDRDNAAGRPALRTAEAQAQAEPEDVDKSEPPPMPRAAPAREREEPTPTRTRAHKKVHAAESAKPMPKKRIKTALAETKAFRPKIRRSPPRVQAVRQITPRSLPTLRPVVYAVHSDGTIATSRDGCFSDR